MTGARMFLAMYLIKNKTHIMVNLWNRNTQILILVKTICICSHVSYMRKMCVAFGERQWLRMCYCNLVSEYLSYPMYLDELQYSKSTPHTRWFISLWGAISKKEKDEQQCWGFWWYYQCCIHLSWQCKFVKLTTHLLL